MPILLNLCYNGSLVIQSKSQSQIYITTDGQSASLLGVKPHVGHKTRFLLLSDSCCFVDLGYPLWRDYVSVVYNCCWPSPVKSFSDLSVAGLITTFSVSHSRFPQPGGPGPLSYLYPPGIRWPSYNPRHWVFFSSPPTTLRSAVEVLEPATTRA
jgi:hypothetical protein